MNTTHRLVAIALLMIGSTGAAAGECVSVRIDTPIVMPDGSDRAAGVLRVCNTQSFSPVASLHATSIDGKSIGLLQSRRLRRGRAASFRALGRDLVAWRGTDGVAHVVDRYCPHQGAALDKGCVRENRRDARAPDAAPGRGVAVLCRSYCAQPSR